MLSPVGSERRFAILFFQARGELFLLLRQLRFQLLYLAVLFEKLVQRYHVHRFIANGVGLALVIVRTKI